MGARDAEVGELLSCQPGDRILDWYSDDSMWHERILVWKGHSEHGCYILTPDLDMYEQDYSLTGGDGPSKFKIKGRQVQYYSRMNAPVYRFATDPTEGEMKSYIEAALDELGYDEVPISGWRPKEVKISRHVAATSLLLGRRFVPRRVTRGLGVTDPPAGTANLAVASSEMGVKDMLRPCCEAPDGKVWLSAENFAGKVVGEEVHVDISRDYMIGETTGLVRVDGGRWLKVELVDVAAAPSFKAARSGVAVAPALQGPKPAPKEETGAEEDAGDARTLFVDFDSQRIRYKSWKAVTQEAREYSYSDWPHEGPASALHLIKAMERQGGDPKLWLEGWCRMRGIAEQDRVKHEMRCLVEILWYAGTFDQLNVPVLASMETAARRIQAVVDAYSVPGSSPDWGNARAFTNYKGPDDVIMPQLRTYAARRGKEEVDLHNARSRMKDLRKPTLPSDEAAEAVADGNLPSGAKAKAKTRSGRRLEAPKDS